MLIMSKTKSKKIINKKINAVRVLLLTAVFLTAVLLAGLSSYAADTSDGEENSAKEKTISVDPTGKNEGFSAVIYDNMNGLPTSEANAIAQTSDGFIWIGSYAGLIRYDGNTFVRMDSTNGLTSIKCLYVDSKDRLWIGTNDNGVAVMERGEIKMWGKLDGMKSAHTRAITEDGNGTIYVATTRGIMMIDSDFNLSSMEDESIAEVDMRSLRTGEDGIIYGTTDQGALLMIQDGKLIKFIEPEDNSLGGVGAIIPDPENPGQLYLEAPDFNFYHVDVNDEVTELEQIDISPLKYVLQMEYIDGKIWICAGNGIGVLENGEFTVLDNLPLNNNVGHVMTDYLGNLWFTSTRQGVMKVVPNPFSDLFERVDIHETVVNSTCMSDGMLFVATDTGLLVIGENGPVSELPLTKAVTASGQTLTVEKEDDDGQINKYDVDDLIELLDGSRIRSIVRDSKDRLWIATWREYGLLCYDHGELTDYTVEDGLLSDSIRCAYECEDGSILVAITGGVNIIRDNSVVGAYGKEDGIETIESLTVVEGFNNDIVLGSNGGGIYIINDSGVKEINVEDGLPSDIVMRLKRDTQRDIIWIVSSNAIAYMTPDYTVTTVHKFPYPNNFDLYENSKGDMWILGSNGIYVVPSEELLANGEINPVFYGIFSGMSCITTANSYSELTSDGDLYIAGSTGVCKVNIEQSFEDVEELKVSVPFVEADGKKIYPNESGEFIIPAKTNKLSIQGFVFNYSLYNPKVTYKLEGFDNHSTTVDRSEMVPIDYTNLKGGTYHFVMEIKDSMGRVSNEISITIIKKKFFYEQTWFILTMIAVALLILAIGVHFYVKHKTLVSERKRQEAYDRFEQTAEALANAIDAKDTYTNGHSRRVAEYSVKIAKEAGKSREECNKIYFAALLHDVGKIGVPIEILTKKGRLTDEEFGYIKQHPVMGSQILSSIKNSPWLSIGAKYHHERYNGTGYPEGLKGNAIPEIARIIAVADAYDAMTSNRSYRNAIPQHIVREELTKGVGVQFDPEYAKIMIHMLDLDTEYRMQESATGSYLSPNASMRCDSIYNDCTEGIVVTTKKAKIRLCSNPDDGAPERESLPTLILFDSLDGKVHPGEENNKDLLYCEYSRVRLDGTIEEFNVRNSEVRILECETDIERADFGEPERVQLYKVEAVRNEDHVLLRISTEKQIFEVILALPDKTRFAYVSISGENCEIHNIKVETEEEETKASSIPRIAEKISYIKGCPVGDIPNVEVIGPRSAATDGIPINNGVTVSFHTMSLPTARLVWHCPYISIFSSEDGLVDGENFREYTLLKLSGESWSFDDRVENEVQVKQRDDFIGWNDWKEKNKQGFDSTVVVKRDGNKITIQTENQGIVINSITKILEETGELYFALTGDQCAITDIHITHDEADEKAHEESETEANESKDSEVN